MTTASRLIGVLLMGVCGMQALAGQAFAVPIQLHFSFVSANSPARADGTIIFESSLLQNPPTGSLLPTDPAILALNVVVTGAASGNGTFGPADFSSLTFVSDLALDYSRELVGQPTLQNPWGTTDACRAGDDAAGASSLKLASPDLGGTSGDFNLFNHLQNSSAPSGQWYFSLHADRGNADCMILVRMRWATAAGG